MSEDLDLTAEEREMLGLPPLAKVALAIKLPPDDGTIEDAQIIPPDAPANDASAPAPDKPKKEKKAKAIIQDESTTPDEVLQRQMAGRVNRQPACGFCGDITPKANHADTCVMRRVNPLSSPAPMAPHPGTLHHTIIELGPESRALIEKLIQALSK